MPSPIPPAIAAVPTSIACFIGRTDQGPVLNPENCLSFFDYENVFGSDQSVSDMTTAVGLFFQNGGTECWITRIKTHRHPSQISDYQAAFDAIDERVSIFNLMILPKENGPHAAAPQIFYTLASEYCAKHNALLFIDPPSDWMTDQDALNPATGINNLRNGITKEQCAIYFPNLKVTNYDGSQIVVGPAGAIAGIMSRFDTLYGVWKTPAGGSAGIQGITGLTFQITDAENDPLNSAGINSLRSFEGIPLCWGARTVAGDDSFQSDWKYIPVRRTAMFIEGSIAAGLRWVDTESNDDILWAKIRISTESFMYQLFQDGALQGSTQQEAFFVKCDSETTTQNDANNGIINITVGFAALRPAEFIILNIQLFYTKRPN